MEDLSGHRLVIHSDLWPQSDGTVLWELEEVFDPLGQPGTHREQGVSGSVEKAWAAMRAAAEDWYGTITKHEVRVVRTFDDGAPPADPRE